MVAGTLLTPVPPPSHLHSTSGCTLGTKGQPVPCLGLSSAFVSVLVLSYKNYFKNCFGEGLQCAHACLGSQGSYDSVPHLPTQGPSQSGVLFTRGPVFKLSKACSVNFQRLATLGGHWLMGQGTPQ